MTDPRTAPLLQRIGDESLRDAAEKCLDVATRFKSRRQSLAADGRFTEVGRVDALRSELGKEFAPAFRRAAQPLKAARERIVARRAAMKPPSPDRSDLVGALERQEIRTMLRNLSDDQRSKLVFSTDDVRVIDAVLTAPPELSGVPKDRFDFLMAKRLEKLFGAESAALDRDEAALENAEAASAVARNDLRSTLDPDAQDTRLFDSIMAGTQGVPWLIKQDTGAILVVRIDDQGRASYPIATPEGEAAGRFFANRQEFEAANATR